MVRASILVKCYDGRPFLESFLKTTFPIIERQTEQRYEVIILYSGAEAEAVEVAAKQRNTRVIRIEPKQFTHPLALNIAAQNAQGEFLVCLSADAVPVDEKWLSSLLKPFEDPEVAGTYGRQLPGEGANPFDYIRAWLWYGPQRKIQTYEDSHAFSNANSAVRKSLWEEHNFDEALREGVEDYEWALWAQQEKGFVIVYEPEAAVYHSHGNPHDLPSLGWGGYWERARRFKAIRASIDEGKGYPVPRSTPYLQLGIVSILLLVAILVLRSQSLISDPLALLLLSTPLLMFMGALVGLFLWSISK